MNTQLRNLFDLKGRTAIVTGATGSLGLQIARALGEFGARLALVGRKADQLAQVVDEMRGAGIVAQAFISRLDDPDGPAALVGEIMHAFGSIDILVNNAGTTWGAAAEDYTVTAWSKVIDLNLSCIFFLTQAVARAAFLPQGKGVVLNIASVEGLQGHHPSRTGTIAYNASKGGVINLTRALAAEWGPKGLRVNALAPGFFPSKMTAGTLDQYGGEIIAQTPLGKLGGPTDLMGPVLLLVSDAGGHITGQVLAVDGGTSII